MERATQAIRQDVDSLVRAIYSAAMDGRLWQGVLEELRLILGADSALIRLYDEFGEGVRLSITAGFDPAFDQRYREHFVHKDVIRDAARRQPVGRVIDLKELLPRGLLEHSEFYNDYMLPQDKYHVIGARPYGCEGVSALLGVQRGKAREPFSPRERALLEMIVGHVQQAFRIHRSLGVSYQRVRSLERVVERSRIGLILLDEEARVAVMNQTAETLLGEGVALSVRNGKVRALERRQDSRLQSAISDAVAAGSGKGNSPGGALSLNKGCRIVVVTPWVEGEDCADLFSRRCVAAILIGTTPTPDALRTEFVADSWGLQRAEAQLAVVLARHGDLDTACGELNITRNTARSYLKSVFKKTNCHRQSDLIRMVLMSPIPLASALLLYETFLL